jgi:predicted phosphodiesterase
MILRRDFVSYTITFIGAIGNQLTFTEQHVLNLLQTQRTDLLHGYTFTGRPSTFIHVDEHAVLKIRGELHLELFSAKRWVAQALEKEKNYQVHHPKKTWFIAESPENAEEVLIGNISPRMQPLHSLFATVTPETSLKYVDYLGKVFELYFRLAKTHHLRLDEGLSNFGIDETGQLYYLDDDIYTWDKFVSCAHMLGVYFRSQAWLNAEIAAHLGQAVHKHIVKYFHDSHYFTVLAELLRDVFMPAPSQRESVEVFIKNLYLQQHQPVINHTNVVSNRYIALMADVHANLPALDSVLKFLRTHHIQQGIVVGDIVGYGTYPRECIERLQENNFLVLKGNHDHGLATGNFKKGFSSTAAAVLEWSQHQIDETHRRWLEELPPLEHNEHWLAVHGSPLDPTFFNAYVYEMTYQNNLDILQRKHISLCIHGHTHLPGIYARREARDEFILNEKVNIADYQHALVCPGSVGQPRNGQPGAQFAIYDQKDKTVTFHNLAYDTTPIIHLMQQHQFPESLVKLLNGEM